MDRRRVGFAAFVAVGVSAGFLSSCSDDDIILCPDGRTLAFADADYEARRFFFVVDPVDPLLTGRLVPPGDPDWIAPPEITDLRLWHDDRNAANNGAALRGVAYLDPRPGALAALDSVIGFFDPLTAGVDFTILEDLYPVDAGSARGASAAPRSYLVVDITDRVRPGEALAATFTATYTIPGEPDPLVIRYGTEVDTGPTPDTILLKALRIPDARYTQFDGEYVSRDDFWYPTRRLEIRSIYPFELVADEELVGARVAENTSHSAHFPGASEEATYLRGLGIDKEDASGQPGFDHVIDRAYQRRDLSLIVLPDLRPFAPAAEDSVWPFFHADLSQREARPAYFVGADANRALYDRLVMAPETDSRYTFDLNLSP